MATSSISGRLEVNQDGVQTVDVVSNEVDFDLIFGANSVFLTTDVGDFDEVVLDYDNLVTVGDFGNDFIEVDFDVVDLAVDNYVVVDSDLLVAA